MSTITKVGFTEFLEKARLAAEEKYGVALTFYWGEYTPDVDNFHFTYYFATEEFGCRVIVNTYGDGDYKLLIHKYPLSFKTPLEPIEVPVGLTLVEAYDRAKARGFDPHLFNAVVFLENYRSSDFGPGYWFLSEQNDRQWIFVSCVDPEKIERTDQQPYFGSQN